MYSQMKFTDSTTKGVNNIDFSELVNETEMFVYAYSIGNSVAMTFTEKEMRELRKHLTIQIRKIKK